MKIDKDVALEILKAEVAAARDGDEPVPADWVELVEGLEEACGNLNKTFFAALATALLARSTDDHVDVYSLKVGKTERGYSARSLCQHVLAAYAPRLGIDLGVKGREPLNNQPFFAEDRISDALPVKPHARPALELLLRALGKLDGMDSSESRLALRAFLRVRQLQENSWVIDPDASEGVRLAVVCERVSSFVAQKSELGKRAQAVAAGIMDVWFTPERVKCGRIHDPDARFPGDVVIVDESDNIVRTFEVRDKKVSDADVHHFAVKTLECGIAKGGVISPANDGADAEIRDALTWAEERGLYLVVFTEWADLLREVMHWHDTPLSTSIKKLHQSILKRLIELEVSPEGIEAWVEIFN